MNLSKFAGILSKETADELEKDIIENRKKDQEMYEKRIREIERLFAQKDLH